MQVVEKSAEGLSRVIAVTIPASELNAKLDAKAAEVAPQMKLKGFRPGKVPVSHVRKTYGRDLMGEIVNDALNQSSQKALDDAKLRPAAPAEMKLVSNMDQVVAGKEDLSYEMALEVMPDFKPVDPKSLKLTRPVYEASDADLDEALKELAGQAKTYEDKGGKAPKAADGDQLTIDFVGKIDGEVFEGGSAEDADLIIGSNRFIPGFEEQLTGLKTGDEKTIKVTFPSDYPAANLKGKDAEFDIKVQQVKVPGETKVDDDFAKSLGLESLDKLKELLRGQLEQETAGLTRTQMKRQLLDKLAADYDFEVPPSMVEAEFGQIWQQIQSEIAKEDDPEAALKEIEDEKDDYRRIAERRVRLGLLLSEIGQANGVEVTQQEMQMLLQQAAQQYRPEDRERFVEYVRNEPMAQAQLRAPLYEDKVVDFLFDKAEITEREVTRDELEAAIEAEETVEEAKPAKKAPAKKADEPKAEAKPAAKKTAAKKAPAKK